MTKTAISDPDEPEMVKLVQAFCALGNPPGVDSREHLRGFAERCTEAFGWEAVDEAFRLVLLDPEWAAMLDWGDNDDAD
jgi:hypothetical protein